jgi:hypothetical protein
MDWRAPLATANIQDQKEPMSRPLYLARAGPTLPPRMHSYFTFGYSPVRPHSLERETREAVVGQAGRISEAQGLP